MKLKQFASEFVVLFEQVRNYSNEYECVRVRHLLKYYIPYVHRLCPHL